LKKNTGCGAAGYGSTRWAFNPTAWHIKYSIFRKRNQAFFTGKTLKFQIWEDFIELTAGTVRKVQKFVQGKKPESPVGLLSFLSEILVILYK